MLPNERRSEWFTAAQYQDKRISPGMTPVVREVDRAAQQRVLEGNYDKAARVRLARQLGLQIDVGYTSGPKTELAASVKLASVDFRPDTGRADLINDESKSLLRGIFAALAFSLICWWGIFWTVTDPLKNALFALWTTFT